MRMSKIFFYLLLVHFLLLCIKTIFCNAYRNWYWYELKTNFWHLNSLISNIQLINYANNHCNQWKIHENYQLKINFRINPTQNSSANSSLALWTSLNPQTTNNFIHSKLYDTNVRVLNDAAEVAHVSREDNVAILQVSSLDDQRSSNCARVPRGRVCVCHVEFMCGTSVAELK